MVSSTTSAIETSADISTKIPCTSASSSQKYPHFCLMLFPPQKNTPHFIATKIPASDLCYRRLLHFHFLPTSNFLQLKCDNDNPSLILILILILIETENTLAIIIYHGTPPLLRCLRQTHRQHSRTLHIRWIYYSPSKRHRRSPISIPNHRLPPRPDTPFHDSRRLDAIAAFRQ